MAHILLLEDNQAFAFLLKASLEDAGHSVELFHDASSAFESFQTHDFDLVIADLMIFHRGQPIPDGGLSLITRIRHRGERARQSVPVIAISGVINAKGLENALVTAETVGADASLSKPFAPKELLALIDQHVPPEKAASKSG